MKPCEKRAVSTAAMLPSASLWQRLLRVSLWSPDHRVAVRQREHLRLLWSDPGVYSRSVPAQNSPTPSSPSAGCLLAALCFPSFEELGHFCWLGNSPTADRQHLFTVHSPADGPQSLFSHQVSSIHVNVWISLHFCDGPSVNLSDQNLFCITPGSLTFYPVGSLAQSGLLYQDPSRGSAIIDLPGFTAWKPGAVPGNSPGTCLRNRKSVSVTSKQMWRVYTWIPQPDRV